MLVLKSRAGQPHVTQINTSLEYRHWTPEEVAKVARGFLDLDLDGPPLHRWCREQGINRTPGAIDQKLQQLEFFDQERSPKVAGQIAKKQKTRAELAARNLRNQIRLARLEAACGDVLPYKPGPL